MAVRIALPTGRDALAEFVNFHDRVYEARDAHWPVAVDLELPILLGESPFNAGRRMRAFTASRTEQSLRALWRSSTSDISGIGTRSSATS
jgi:hypothetical protein